MSHFQYQILMPRLHSIECRIHHLRSVFIRLHSIHYCINKWQSVLPQRSSRFLGKLYIVQTLDQHRLLKSHDIPRYKFDSLSSSHITVPIHPRIIKKRLILMLSVLCILYNIQQGQKQYTLENHIEDGRRRGHRSSHRSWLEFCNVMFNYHILHRSFLDQDSLIEYI